MVGILIIVSMIMFSRLMQRLSDLQISNVLHLIGDQGRVVIRDMFPRLEQEAAERASQAMSDLRARLAPATQGEPPRQRADAERQILGDRLRLSLAVRQ